MWLMILFIILGIFARLIPHIPNVAPLAAVALFSGVYLNRKHGYLIPLGIYIISDLIIGFHNTIFFTWFSIVLIYFLGFWLRRRKTVTNTASFTLLSSILFFIVTNFGVWLMGWYPQNLEGLKQCFIYALPFFRLSLIANFAYVAVFFGAYEYFLSKKKSILETA